MRAHALSSVAATALAACSSLDPQTGAPSPSTCVDADSDPAHAVVFARDIRPLMNRSQYNPTGAGCYTCHYPQGSKRVGLIQSGLDLSTLGKLRKGGRTTGEYIIDIDEPCSSGLVMKLRGVDGLAPVRMPRDAAPWKASEIQLVIDWMAEGANGSDDE